MTKTLIVLVGPTASGKTALAIQLAQKYQTEIVSADSRQFYIEMTIGTAKPSPEELSAAKHHFINSHHISENFNVGDFEIRALEILNNIFEQHNTALLVGGSGLYINAVCNGFDNLPKAPLHIREQLNQKLITKGIGSLQEQLLKFDPVYYKEVDINNPQRIIRALEVYMTTGQPFSAYRTRSQKTRPFKCLKIGLNMDRTELYDRINKRVDQMMAIGLEEEVKTLLPYRHLNALNTVGYSELFDYFDKKITRAAAIEKIKQNTRRYAKRQLTWFKKDPEVMWINPNDGLEAIRHLLPTNE